MNILEITIQYRRETGWPVVGEHTRSGELKVRSEGELLLDKEYEDRLAELSLDGHAYGAYLGEALFQGPLRDLFMAARASADGVDEALRLLLVVEDPHLKPLRWERLCVPAGSGGWDYLALDQRTLCSRYLPSLTDRRFAAIGRRDLRALVVLADPPETNKYQLTPFDVAATAASLGKALGEIPFEMLGSLENAVGPATLDALSASLTADHFTLLHLVAHGAYRKDGETEIYLLDEAGQVARVTATELIKHLRRLRRLPHLAFLATCESARPEAEAALGGLAQRLVRELGIPTVVAMTERVSIATAEALANIFYTRLRAHGEADRALVEATAGLQGRFDITVPALFSRLEGRALFSDPLDGRPLTDAEIQYGLKRLEGLLPERAPVLEAQFAVDAQTLRATLGAAPQALTDEARKERDNVLDAINGTCDEVLDLSFSALASDQPVPAYNPRCPFPGLKAFQTGEQEFFFGREGTVEELTKRLRDGRFLAILGGSGSGKSSIVLAGMIPVLEAQTREAGRALEVRYLNPGTDPETVLLQISPPLPAAQPTLLVVDQFEELFTLCSVPSRRKGFLDALLGAWEDHSELLIVLTMRADFWGDCAPYPQLKDLMQTHQELLAPMTTSELRSAMDQQAARVGLRFEADLSHDILAEVEGEPGAMPLLQHLLRELWKRRHGRWLKRLAYKTLGGIQEAIAKTADNIYGELQGDKEGQGLLRNIFVRLTRLDGKTNNQEQYRDTCQRVAFEDLVPHDADAERVRVLVQRLADARLVVITTDENTRISEVEVSHEALIQHWPRLRTWLNEDRESWMLLAAVRQQATDWRRSGKRDSDLPRWSERLQRAGVLFAQVRFAQSKLEREFLDRARALAEREQNEKEERERREREALEQAKEAAEREQQEAERAKVAAEMLAKEEEKRAAAAERAAKEQKKKKQIAWIGVVVALMLLVITGLFGRQTFLEKKRAEREAEAAVTARGTAEQNKREAFHQLAMTYWNYAISERDRDPLKAAHYFALASETFFSARDPAAMMNADLARKFTYGWPLLQVVIGHKGAVEGVQISADELRILTWSADGSARLWDSDSGEAVVPPMQHQDPVNGAVFNSDRTRILTWSGTYFPYNSRHGSARLWYSDSGDPVTPPMEHEDPVDGALFNADESRILTWSKNSARLWDSESGQLLIPPMEHENPLDGAKFSADGSRILTWSEGGVRLWDSNSGKPVTPLIVDVGGLAGVQFNADESRILTWGKNSARLWDSKSGEPVTPPMEHNDPVYGALFSADESRILTWCGSYTVDGSNSSGSARMWDSSTGKALLSPLIHQEPVNGAIFNANESRILTWSGTGMFSQDSNRGGSARLWDSASGEALTPPMAHNDSVNGARFSPDESRILTWSADGSARLWDGNSGKALSPPMEHKESVDDAWFSADGSRIFTRTNSSIRIWNSNNGKALTPPLLHENPIRGAQSFAADSRILSWSGALLSRLYTKGAASVRLWDSEPSAQERLYLLQNGEVNGAQFTADGSRILTWGTDGTANLWESKSGDALTRPMAHEGSVNGARFSANESRILTWGADRSARLWYSDSGKAVTLPMKHENQVLGARFNGDGSRVLTWSGSVTSYGIGFGDVSVQVWDSNSGKAVTPRMKDVGCFGVNIGARFSADESRILTWCGSNARLWDSLTGKVVTTPMAHGGEIYDAKFSADGAHVLTWGWQSVRVWDSDNGKELSPLMKTQNDEYHNDVTLREDRNRILVWDGENNVWVWDIATGKALTPAMKHESNVNGAIFSPDGSRILTWSDRGREKLWDHAYAQLWDSHSGVAVTPKMVHESEVVGARFSADGSHILTWDKGGARLWKSMTGDALTPRMEHEGGIIDVSFCDDESRILTWNKRGAILWDSSSGVALTPQLQTESEIERAQISADGERVLILTRDRALIWNLSVDVGWPADKKVMRTEVETGTILTPTGELNVLEPSIWQEKKWCQYDEIQHNLGRITEEQWHTSQRLCGQHKHPLKQN